MKILRLISPLKKLIALVVIITLLFFCIDWLYGVVMVKLYPRDYSEYVEKYCEEYSVSKSFAYAFIKCESNFDKNALSSAGAKGLMQLTDETFAYLTERETGQAMDPAKITDPQYNIRFGIYYISYLSEKFQNDKSLVIAAYNAGPGKVTEWLNDPNCSSDGETIHSYPYKETENHIKKVLKAQEKYIQLYEKEN